MLLPGIFSLLGTKPVFSAITAIAGFGVGRIKNSSKLAAIKTELQSVASGTVTDAKTLAAKITSKL